MRETDTLQYALARKELANLREEYDRLRNIPVGMFRQTASGLEAAKILSEEVSAAYWKIQRLEEEYGQ